MPAERTEIGKSGLRSENRTLEIAVDAPLVTQFLVQKNCVIKGVSDKCYYYLLVQQLYINFKIFATSFHPYRK